MSQPAPPSIVTGPRILVAEDDPILAEILSGALRARGHSVDVVTDGLNAVRRMRSEPYALVVLDVQLPEVDGHATARLAHDLSGEGPRPRLIAFTGGAEALAARLEAAGSTPFDSIVAKPDGLPALLKAIDSNLEIADAHARMAMALRDAAALRQANDMRRRRRLSPLAAMPALGMTLLFALACWWGVAVIAEAEQSREASRQVVIRTADNSALVEAVEDAEASQRLLLLQGTQEARAAFEAELRRVDRMLISAAPMDDAGMRGFEPATAPHGLIDLRLRSLAVEAEAPSDATAEATAERGAIDALRNWAMAALRRSHVGLEEGLAGIQKLGHWIVGVLIVGGLYGLVNAAFAVRARLREAAPPVEDSAWDGVGGAAHLAQQPVLASGLGLHVLSADDAPSPGAPR